MQAIGILGAGTWGMALAKMLSNNGHAVTVWSAIPAEIDRLAADRKHPNLKSMVIPTEVAFTKDISVVCKEKEIVLFAVPSIFVRDTARKAKPFLPNGQIIVNVAKGIEPSTLLMMTEVIRDEVEGEGGPEAVKLVALSGPTHAEEVAMDLPTTIVSACEDLNIAEAVRDVFMNTCMRVYTNVDVLGVEICGALKNIIALAAGISDGLGFGDNAKAAIITRGITEIARLGLAMGCIRETFSGLAGLGDLVVTCTSRHSRNNRAGNLIGQGYSADAAAKEVGMVVEGINALPAAMVLSEKYAVELPIISGVEAIVHQNQNPLEIVNNLMGRDPKAEHIDLF